MALSASANKDRFIHAFMAVLVSRSTKVQITSVILVPLGF